MNRLNADGHDESQYNPRGVPPVNPFRMQHGSIKWEGEAIKALTWLPDILRDIGYIEKGHHDTCKSFERILIQAKRTLNICQLKGALFEKPPEMINNDTDMYLLLKNKLILREMEIMIWLVEEENSKENLKAVNFLIGKIIHAIENSQRIIDNAKKSA